MSPNVLLICTDQQRFDALGAYGNTHIATPNLDRLAADGVLFENCYVQNPVCAPSRASLMTGQYVSAHGLHANGVDIAPGAEMFTKLLAAGGYDCGVRASACPISCCRAAAWPLNARRPAGLSLR